MSTHADLSHKTLPKIIAAQAASHRLATSLIAQESVGMPMRFGWHTSRGITVLKSSLDGQSYAKYGLPIHIYTHTDNNILFAI